MVHNKECGGSPQKWSNTQVPHDYAPQRETQTTSEHYRRKDPLETSHDGIARASRMQGGYKRANNTSKLKGLLQGALTPMDVEERAHNGGVQDLNTEERENNRRQEVEGRTRGHQGRVGKAPSINPPEDDPEVTMRRTSKRRPVQQGCGRGRGRREPPKGGT